MRPAYIYLLHFNTPLHHAEHYSGCTTNLRQRLRKHAAGHGSRLTRALFERGIEWTLAALHVTSEAGMRRAERDLKAQHSGPSYCPICTKCPRRIPTGTPYDIELIPYPTSSMELRTLIPGAPQIYTTRTTTADEPRSTLDWIKDGMCRAGGNVGYIPCHTDSEGGVAESIRTGKIILAETADKQLLGYTLFGSTDLGDRVKIMQCYTADDARLIGVGRAMVNQISNENPTKIIRCKVRANLAANDFWRAIGFEYTESETHRRSGNVLHSYKRDPIEPFNYLKGLDNEL